MNKTELVNAIAAKAEISKVDAKKALDAALEAVAAALATKETIEIAARKVVKFKAGAELNDKVK